jgi:hypothetical protein
MSLSLSCFHDKIEAPYVCDSSIREIGSLSGIVFGFDVVVHFLDERYKYVRTKEHKTTVLFRSEMEKRRRLSVVPSMGSLFSSVAVASSIIRLLRLLNSK